MTPTTNDAKMIALRKALGYIQDGSSVTVKIFQDDATRDFHIEYGKSGVWGKNFNEAFDRLVTAMNDSQTSY